MNSSGRTPCRPPGALVLVLGLKAPLCPVEHSHPVLDHPEAMTPWRHVDCVSWDGKAISPFLSFIQENTVGYGHQR